MDTKDGRLSIAEVTSEDIEDLVYIGKECCLSYWSPEGYAAELERPDSILLAVRVDGRLVAFLAARASSAGDGELFNIGVVPEYRRTGIARVLLDELISRCLLSGATKLWLDVRESNIAAIGLYGRLGFTKVSVRKGFYSRPAEDSVTMVLELPRSQSNP